MTPQNKLTAEQKQFIADMMAEMLAENAKAAKPKRIKMNLPHEDTAKYNIRLPIEMGDAVQAMAEELGVYQNHIVYYLLRYAITSGFTDQMESIVRLNSFQQYRNSFKK